MSTSRITADTKLARNPAVLFRYLDDEAVLYDDERHNAVALDPTGAMVWRFLEEPTSVAELAADFADAYGAPLAQVTDDLLTLATTLADQSLLRPAGAASTAGASPVDEVSPVLPDPPGH